MADVKPAPRIRVPKSESADSESSAATSDQLARARQISAAMKDATNELNASLQRAERAFAELGLGVSASVCISPATDQDEWVQNLKFGKEGSEWKLMLESGPDGGDAEQWTESPLLRASRETRAKATRFLSELLDALLQEAEKQAKRIRSSASRVDKLLETLNARGAK